jgi:uncharacterized protein (DUF58 family)
VTELPPELFAQIKAIQIRTQHLVTAALAGDYESAFKGRGMEFEEVRAYQPGDDVRHIDWNVTARMQAPFVKVHREERELTVMLLCDLSASGDFGSADKLKNEIAAEVAAVLAYTAIRSNDRVGLILFTDHIELFMPPKKGRSYVWRVIREILRFRPERIHRGTDFAAALATFAKVVRRNSVAFLISDFVDVDLPASGLRAAAAMHDLTAVTIQDPRERELPSIGLIELEDAETGAVVLIDTGRASLRDGYARAGRQEDKRRQDQFRSAGIDEILIRTDRSYVDPIVRFFRSRP